MVAFAVTVTSPDPRVLTEFCTEIIPPLTVMAPVNPLLSPVKSTSPAPDLTKLPAPLNVPRNCGLPEVVFRVKTAPVPIAIAPEPVKVEVVAEELSTRFAPAATESALALMVAPEPNVKVPAETVVVPE